MKSLLPLCILLSVALACGNDDAADRTTATDPTDVSNYAPPAAPAGKAETRLEQLERNSIDDTDTELRIQRALHNALDHIRAAEPAVADLNDVRITAKDACSVSVFNTRADGVEQEYRMNLGDFDYVNGLELRADNGADVPHPGIGFFTKGREQTIQLYENGIAMGRTAEFPLVLDTRERVQEAVGDLLIAMRICQDPDFR